MVLSASTFGRLVRSTAEEDALKLYLASLTAGERRAFWSALLIVDGRITVERVRERAAELARLELGEARPRASVHDVDMRDACAYCGEPMDEPVRTHGGRRPIYHDACRRALAADRQRARRAGA